MDIIIPLPNHSLHQQRTITPNHTFKDTVNKYVKEYDKKRAELLALNPSQGGRVVKLDIGGMGYRNYQMAVFTSAKSNYRFGKLYVS